ncbi:hypothetical protein AB0I87_13400 [Streptomyces sp. NPDC049952]|uniref:hypothetical protein n=1 Tax=Streptomyces sp. NPDC049952 TaxID=3156665 RepID=UPI0034375536
MNQQLFTVEAFSNAPEHKLSRGHVYIVTDLSEEQKDALVARESEQNPDRWLKVTAQ